jgi:hypothetical protein
MRSSKAKIPSPQDTPGFYLSNVIIVFDATRAATKSVDLFTKPF